MYDGCTGDAKPDIEQASGCTAHPPCHRNTDQKCRSNTLNHYKTGFSKSVEESYEAEKETGEQAVDGISFQVVKSG